MPNSVRSKQTCVTSRSPVTRTPHYGSILPLRRKLEDYNRVEFIPALLRNFQKQAAGYGGNFGLLAVLQKMSGPERSWHHRKGQNGIAPIENVNIERSEEHTSELQSR